MQTTVNTKEEKDQIRLCNKTPKKPDPFWIWKMLWTDETRINLYQNDEKGKVWRSKETHNLKNTTPHGMSVMAWAWLQMEPCD